MKKILLVSVLLFVVMYSYGLELRTRQIFGGFARQGFSCDSVKDIFYINENDLIISATYFGTERFFKIDGNYEISEISLSNWQKVSDQTIKEQDGIKIYLDYNYYIRVSDTIIDSESEVFYRTLNYEPKPYFFYIYDLNNTLVFNFNTWKLNHKEYYPVSDYNGLSEEIFFTEEEQVRQMKLRASYTVIPNHLTVNSTKNKIAIVMDQYDSNMFDALIIFDVLYNATINDFKVRLREEPNLNCKIISYFYTGNKVKITDRSEEKYTIDGESWYWYKVESGSYPSGWVYGKYLDIEK